MKYFNTILYNIVCNTLVQDYYYIFVFHYPLNNSTLLPEDEDEELRISLSKIPISFNFRVSRTHISAVHLLVH